MKKKKRGNRSKQPLALIALGAVLIAAALLVILWNPSGAPEAASTTSPNSNLPYPEVDRVSITDAKAAYDLKTAVFVDVRGDPYYQQNHIPGAVSVPYDRVENHLAELDKSAWIITYCT